MNQHWIIPGDNQLHESTGTHGAETQQNPLVKLDPGLFIWTILTFVLISTILAKFAWKPLLAMLQVVQPPQNVFREIFRRGDVPAGQLAAHGGAAEAADRGRRARGPGHRGRLGVE